jgi:hypothetical protein
MAHWHRDINTRKCEDWNTVLDVFGSKATKLSVRTPNIDARVLSHDNGWWGAQAGMILGSKSAHPLSFELMELRGWQ